MGEEKSYPYKGQAVIPRLEKQANGKYAACFTIHAGKDRTGEIRYARGVPTIEFDSEDEALGYILDFSGDWIDQNPI
ncbi:hypothetical protein CAter282_2950 [Collimonas arenae]|uniref:Uncharacterized protein n=1 Tax=Collimonas arenae TaxID=279058 RepID=A0A127QM51_9BURK|nr:hypothetical protein [Collimonas arenae]AMP10672.1 hypothetical protein CAter282_2950 [Collimonas arenae]